MRAQVTLIPAESKKLIAKAVVKLDEVQNALANGRVVISLGSSTIFVVEELIGKMPDITARTWIRGLITPKGACAETKRSEWKIVGQSRELRTAEFPFMWVFEKGELMKGAPLKQILEEMKPQDVAIKGVNAIDPYGSCGILTGDRIKGGTFGLVFARQREVGFKTVFPVGLEKLIPIPIKEAVKEASPTTPLPDYSMGRPCGLLPCDGIVVTEPKAIEMLTGAKAVPISAGGLAGAEGAITMVVSGSDEQVKKAIALIEGVKGTRLPELDIRECEGCDIKVCSLMGGTKHWC